MNKKMLKIFGIIIIGIMIISISTTVLGTTLKDLQPGSIKTDKDVTGTTQLKKAGQDIVGIIRAVGIVLSVAIVSVLGIKYMMGSAEEKAGYKKSMLPYLIGAIILFAASNLAEVVYKFANGINETVITEEKEEDSKDDKKDSGDVKPAVQ